LGIGGLVASQTQLEGAWQGIASSASIALTAFSSMPPQLAAVVTVGGIIVSNWTNIRNLVNDVTGHMVSQRDAARALADTIGEGWSELEAGQRQLETGETISSYQRNVQQLRKESKDLLETLQELEE